MNALITKSLEESNITHLLNFPKQFYSEFEKEMVKWIAEYTMKYGKPPTVDRLLEVFEMIPIRSSDPLGDIYDQTLQKKRNLYSRQYLVSIQDHLKAGADPLPYIRELNSTLSAGGSDVTFYTRYDRTLHTRKADAFPYEINQLDQYTGGISKGDLIYLVGRLGTGKTTFALWILTKWLQRNRRVLMVSNENRAEDLVGKIDAFIGGWNPLKKRTMEWTEDDLNKIKTVSYIASRLEGEVVIPNKPVQGVEELNGLVYAYQPDIVIVDGIYLMSGVRGESHWEKITDVSRNLKRLAEAEGSPIFGIHQANRNAVGKRIEIEHIAYADALAQDADLVLAINKDKEEEDDLFVECIKNRWGADHWGFFMRFFFDSMTAKVFDARTEPLDAVS